LGQGWRQTTKGCAAVKSYHARLIREQLKLTQVQMARALGLSLTHWRNIERGRAEAGHLVDRVLLLLEDSTIRPEDLTDARAYVPDVVFVSGRSNSGVDFQ
jgi:transcriptional regulator with XRE-family HTH domain